MKIGILTYHRAHNYGAMLQAYALRRVLRDMQHNVDFIDYWPKEHQEQYTLIRPLRGQSLGKRIIAFLAGTLTLTKRYRRIRHFERFASQYLCVPASVQYTHQEQTIKEQYDCVVVGSDQIWRNKESNGKHIGFDPVYFGQNLPDYTRCISYAASMGIIDLHEHDLATLQQYLNRFDTILVRENSLKTLINQLNLPAEVVLDPTLLLTQEAWNALLPTTPYRTKQYVLYYELLPSPSALAFAREQAHAMQCDLLVMDAVIHTIPRSGHISAASPIEFLHAIRDAKYIVATSFHGTAFSVIFEKQFITIGLHANADRVKTLLKHLHIEDHYQPTPTIVPTIDYATVTPLLADMRQQSLQRLTDAIHSKSNCNYPTA